MKPQKILLLAMPFFAMAAAAQPQPQTVDKRMMWASVNTVSNASTGSYTGDNNKLLISWRMLPTDTWDTSFLLYRRTASNLTGSITRVTSQPVTNATCYQISTIPTSASVYYLLPGDYFGEDTPPFSVAEEDRQALRESALDSLTLGEHIYKDKLPYLSIPLKSTEDVCAIKNVYYGANDISIGDLDGDGQMDIVVKRLQMVTDDDGNILSDGSGASYSVKECLYAVIWDAYKLDGTFLWRVKGGPGVILGNSSAFAVADFDGDGCAEMAIRTSEGTVFGDGQEIGDVDGDGKIDYRTWGNQNSSSPGWVDHYSSAGPEFISIIDGKTGKELARDNFIARETSSSWGDDYWKRACSFRVGVACFDDLPSVVFGRGIYARSVLEAWDYRNGKLTRRWHFDSSAAGGSDKNKDGKPNSAYGGQGNHSFSVADLDGDGKDEVMYGSMAIDDDGYGLWTTQLGHGDAQHVGKFLPDREGLQVYHCLESGKTQVALHDAKDGKVIWSKVAASDNDTGRALVADIDASSPGCEFWWAGSNAYSQDGTKDLGYKPASCNMAIWFDGTLTRQLLDGDKMDGSAGRTFTLYRYDMSYNNGSKKNPGWYGDLLGDWREEIIVPDATKCKDLKIFSTWYPTSYKFPWLMSDHTYWMSCLNQNIGYNQPNHVGGYFLGNGMDMSQVPVATGIHDVTTVLSEWKDNGKIYDLSGREVKNPKAGIYVKNGRKFIVK